jgi:hypothetical protein
MNIRIDEIRDAGFSAYCPWRTTVTSVESTDTGTALQFPHGEEVAINRLCPRSVQWDNYAKNVDRVMRHKAYYPLRNRIMGNRTSYFLSWNSDSPSAIMETLSLWYSPSNVRWGIFGTEGERNPNNHSVSHGVGRILRLAGSSAPGKSKSDFPDALLRCTSNGIGPSSSVRPVAKGGYRVLDLKHRRDAPIVHVTSGSRSYHQQRQFQHNL